MSCSLRKEIQEMKKAIFTKLTMAVVVAAVVFSSASVTVDAMTKKQVNSEITRVKKQISKDTKAYPKVQMQDNQTNARYTQIYGFISSRENPFVVLDDTSGKYLSFKDPSGLSIVEQNQNAVSGLALISDKSFTWNGYAVYEASVVSYAHKAKDILDRIDSNNARLRDLQNSKKELLAIDGATISRGQSAKLVTHFSYNTQDINKLTWKSSNKKVVTVSRDGVVTGKKRGSAVISAKLSVTGKIYRTVVNVQ